MAQVAKIVSINEASAWASEYLGRNVTPSNISYLIQYGRIKKVESNGKTYVDIDDLLKYYNSYIGRREVEWKRRLGEDLNWHLSFDNLREYERTKHVHRLHPYKGKFIPQLVEYFIDSHIDEFKKEVYFHKGDIILDPFCGSGTALVQANELGIHAIGIDISGFNALISNVKISKYNLINLYNEARKITIALRKHISDSNTVKFEGELKEALANFNNKYFPSPDFKYRVRRHEINEGEYGLEKESEFRPIYNSLINKYNIKLNQGEGDTFLDKWYIEYVRQEIDYVHSLIKQVEDENVKKALLIILSRTIRSCRATTHFDLATLKEPVYSSYYCHKHGKICKPLFSIVSWWVRYCQDSFERLSKFDKLRTDTYQVCLTGDARTSDIFEELEKKSPFPANFARNKRIKGIFSSPPYVGLIDYHDQHAYAYDLFKLERKDQLEIGPLSNGQGTKARESYIESISEVLNNCRRFLVNDFDIFLVANDKYNLYPEITQRAGMQIVNKHRRPVLNRTERDKGAYSETIFHLRKE